MTDNTPDSYALCTLSPMKNNPLSERSYCDIVRERLRVIPQNETSPFAAVPNLYTVRFFILDDVRFEALPAADRVFNFSQITSIFSNKARLKALPREDHLRSHYLVMISYFYGDLETQLKDLWNNAKETVKDIWEYCYAFDSIGNGEEFYRYIKECQVEFTFFFNGSTITDDPNDNSLASQLKGLYLKQELAKFAREHQHDSAEKLKEAFLKWENAVQSDNLVRPRWHPGKSTNNG